ncbi:hypothetical protein L1987_50890 [Smallanthus sonchifolius]|uniref:Uncharacterized protein n=1 Tax=Smallanthus sonchifolius TaxID=185202 RepID=A0ACB9EP40_9ASTR|nr:hypothetical protein L1987_50890 [Smallanthus sonchifolius]
MNTVLQLPCSTPAEIQLEKKGWCSCGCTECDDPTVPHDYFGAVLDYINDMLMGEEDDLMNKSSMYHDCSALQATEKSFYHVLAQKQPTFPSIVKALDLNLSSIQLPEASQFNNENLVRVSVRGKKNRQPPECGGYEQQRSNKQVASGPGEEELMQTEIMTMIDKLLLCPGLKEVGLHDELACCPFDKPVNPLVEKLLKKIRNHSSPKGDFDERLAHYFADALEARFVDTGMDLYTNIASSKINACDIVKAYQVYVSTCPFKKMSNIYANKMIGNLARGSLKLHIIDFGILYGFQWPCLIQGLSARPGGPPSLRITGIDFPQPFFRPAERVQDTGHRLTDYCKTFNVPFEYHAIAKQWDSVTLEDLRIEEDEILVVNCLYRLRNVFDESVLGSIDCPRESVLKLIKSIKLDLFIHGVVNGNYNAPFFLTRFCEAYFNFSVLFDMRIESPETYKQWQARNERAGFKAVPMNHDIMKEVKVKVKIGFHKDFMVDNDGDWMVQGWKGRVIYAISSWKTA